MSARLKTDPEQRTLFIDEFRRWDIDLKVVLAAVKNSDSPALRSGICLAVGQISPEKLIDADKESWKLVASQWFVEHGDTSTHSAAGWLLRHWQLPLPEIPKPQEITPQRDWFVVKTTGATMLRIRPEPPAPAAVIPDPVEKYRQQLAALESAAAAELDKPAVRMERAVVQFQTENMDRALEDLTFLMEHEPGDALPTVLMYRTLTLARMGKADDARQSLARYLKQEVPASYRIYIEILVAAWVGDIPEASRQLETASRDASIDQNTMYNLACAAARCAEATSGKDADQSQQFANRAIELLEGVVSRGYKNAAEAGADADFVILHSDARFRSVLAEMDETEQKGKVDGEFWIGDREVTRGQAQRKGGLDETTEYDAWRQIFGANGYRLLLQSEWEYACRAGASTQFSSGDDETLLVDYCQMYPSQLTAVCGEKLPNAWGLHDVHGNVKEWCWGMNFHVDSFRALRGGSFKNAPSLFEN